MYSCEYIKPGSLDEAAAALRESDDAKLLAGGMTLLPAMKLRLAAPAVLIDLSAIEGLSGIEVTADHIEIGALTRHDDVASSGAVREAIPALAALAGEIGDPQVRNRGTIGGSIANNDPAADYPAALVGLGATIVTDRRQIGADDFFTDMFETSLESDEIVTSVRFPRPARAARRRARWQHGRGCGESSS